MTIYYHGIDVFGVTAITENFCHYLLNYLRDLFSSGLCYVALNCIVIIVMN